MTEKTKSFLLTITLSLHLSNEKLSFDYHAVNEKRSFDYHAVFASVRVRGGKGRRHLSDGKMQRRVLNFVSVRTIKGSSSKDGRKDA